MRPLTRNAATWWVGRTAQHVRSVRKRTVTYWLLGSLILISIAWHGYSPKLFVVQTNSMSPYMRAGDIVLTVNTTLYQTRVGDVVSYRSLANSKLVVTHRVATVNPLKGLLTTKGDANVSPDTPINGTRIVGKVALVAPGIGKMSNLLHSWQGLVVAVYLPMAALVYYEIVHMLRYYTRPTYRLHGRKL